MDCSVYQMDAVPLVKYYIEKTGIVNIFHKHLDQTTKSTIPVSQSLGILLTNILTASNPLYQVNEWLKEYTDGKAEEPTEANQYNDDRLGRALDTLYKADRQSLLAEISAAAIKTHSLKTDRIHNDTTTVTFAGAYEDQPEDTVQLKHGHNKDGRPDDKQIVFGLNITEDGHVPLSFNLYDGNQNDDTTHQANWDTLREFIGKEDFIYIADCKLASFSNLQHISDHGGKFITTMPCYHLECKTFIKEVKEKKIDINWTGEYKVGNSRSTKLPNIYKVYEGKKSRSGYRIVWVHSSDKARAEEEFRNRHIKKAEKELEEIITKLNKRNLRSLEGIEKSIKKATKRVKEFFKFEILTEKFIEETYSKRGKPAKEAKPTKSTEKTKFHLKWTLDTDKIESAKKVDGIYPLVTNTDLVPTEVLTTYKKQSYLEKRFYTKKSVLEVAPVFLKKPERIEAVLFLYFVALMIISLMERHLRKAMEREAVESLPILPSRMKTKSPTWRVIRNYCREIHMQIIREEGVIKNSVVKGVNDVHSQLFRLFGLPEGYYEDLRINWWVFFPESN